MTKTPPDLSTLGEDGNAPLEVVRVRTAVQAAEDDYRNNPRFRAMGSTDGRMIYARPHCPSKRDGRRGTRKAWRRENPPGMYMWVRAYDGDGNLREEYLWI